LRILEHQTDLVLAVGILQEARRLAPRGTRGTRGTIMPFVSEDKTIAVSGASACQSLMCPSQSATNFRPLWLRIQRRHLLTELLNQSSRLSELNDRRLSVPPAYGRTFKPVLTATATHVAARYSHFSTNSGMDGMSRPTPPHRVTA